MEVDLSIDSSGDRRFLRRKRLGELSWTDRDVCFSTAEYRAKQMHLKKNRRKGIEGGGVAPLCALHGDPQPEGCFRDAVVEKDNARDDLKRVAVDTLEDTLDVMDEDDGIFEGVQFVRTHASPEAETSEHAGQTSDIDRHAEIAPQERTGIGAVRRQVWDLSVLSARAGYESQFSVTGRTVHACTSARNRVQTCRNESGRFRRSAVSALAHGAQSVRSLPERRSQMFPQRSQYFSSILLNCKVVDFAFIISSPFTKNSLSSARGKSCRSWTPDKEHAIADDRARFVCDALFVLCLLTDDAAINVAVSTLYDRNQVSLRSSLRVK
jgi:hypothetical protein